MSDEAERQRVYVGLGNPGKKYEMTRHNLGYLVIHSFAHLHGIALKEDGRFQAVVGKGNVKGVQVHLVLPTTYMNESGVAVRKYLDYYKLAAPNLTVISDDVALPFGEARLRDQGSAGGHNGLKSVKQHLGTAHYARLRMGIGSKHENGSLTDHVLDRFNKSETDQLASFLDQGVKALEMLLKEEAADVMSRVNIKKQKAPREDSKNE